MRINKREKVFFILIVILLLMGVGYAYLNTNLNILGNTVLSAPTWDVHFENVKIVDGSIIPDDGPTINSNGNTINYTITLSSPGEYFDFFVDAKNDGSIDAMIDSVDLIKNKYIVVSESDIPQYIDYKFTYLDGKTVEKKHILKAGETETFRLSIKYRDDLAASELPTSDVTLKYGNMVLYKQADSTAINRNINQYVYALNRNSIHIGDKVTNIDHFYYTYQEALASVDNQHQMFIRYTINKNNIINFNLGFIYNNNAYILSNDENTGFQDNLNMIKSLFACAETDGYYLCEPNRGTPNIILFKNENQDALIINNYLRCQASIDNDSNNAQCDEDDLY